MMRKQNKNRLAIPALLLTAGLLTGCTTPLQKASIAGDTTTVQRLLATRPEQSELNKALCRTAFRSDNPEVIKLLLDHGADPNARYYSTTALRWAAWENHPQTVELLLDRGADINARANNGGTALTAAAACGHLECVRILLERGADKEIPSGMIQMTARDEALRGRHMDIVKLLDESASQPSSTVASRISARSVSKPVLDFDLKTVLPSLDTCLKSEYVGKSEVTDAAVHAKNKELPNFLTEASDTQKTALQSVLDQEILRAKGQMQSMNQSAKNAISSGQSAAFPRKMVGFTKAYINILNEMKAIIEGS